MTNTFTDYTPESLPTAVTDYLDARDEQRHADAASTFAPDAVVLDDGRTHTGIAEISAWIQHSSSEYSYTSTRVGQQVMDASAAVVQVRVDGNFPGGTVTLRYQFGLTEGQIRRLAIEV